MTLSKTTFEIDTDEFAVYSVDKYGERWDLNAEGAEITSEDELIEFVNELREQGAFDDNTRDELIDQI